MDGTCSTYGREERCVQDFGGETWGTIIGRRRWKDNMKMEFQEVG